MPKNTVQFQKGLSLHEFTAGEKSNHHSLPGSLIYCCTMAERIWSPI